MRFSFDGKVALVTGAAMGIGFATAKAFAEAGARTVLVDCQEDKLLAATDTLTSAGLTAMAVTCDVSNATQVEAMISRTVEAYGQLDAAFNNAGINSGFVDLLDTDDAAFDRLIAINLRGVWLCQKAEVRQMVTQADGGAIVNCSSISGLAGGAGFASYSAAKHGVSGLTASAALEYARKGVRINAVAPGPTETPMGHFVTRGWDREIVERMMESVPIGRLAQPNEIAAPVLFLCSSAASMIVGHTLPVDGGILAR
jgi:NAD(P)-dependent dehydrogenase (short-subunit alcohol dehydrogenase family)